MVSHWSYTRSPVASIVPSAAHTPWLICRLLCIYRYNYQIKIQVWFLFCWKLTASLTNDLPVVSQFWMVNSHIGSLWTNHITLWKFNIAIENGHLQWVFPLKMVIFHSYVKLPEGSLMMSYEPIKSSAISVRSSRLLWDSRRHRHSLQQGRCLTLASPGGWWFENLLGYFLTKEP